MGKRSSSATTREPSKKVKSKIVKAPAKLVASKQTQKSQQANDQVDETAYEALMHKVNEKKAQEQREIEQLASTKSTCSKTKGKTNETDKVTSDRVSARVFEDYNYVDMDISGIRQEFPSEEDEDENSEDEEMTEISNSTELNTNANRQLDLNSAKDSSASGASPWKRPSTQQTQVDDAVPHSLNTDPEGNPMNEAKDENNISDIAVTLNLMQDFMVQKGLIKTL